MIDFSKDNKRTRKRESFVVNSFSSPLFFLAVSTDAQVVNVGYVLYNNKFVFASADTPIEAHQCYILVTSDDNTPTIVYIDDVNGDVSTSIDSLSFDSSIKSVKYYNVVGSESDKPFPGVNIVVKERMVWTIETSNIFIISIKDK